jgi:fructosamine-3-kinase
MLHVARLKVFVVLLALEAAPSPPTAAPPKSLAQLREDVQPLVAGHCGKCHSPASPKVMAAALKVFDSDQRDWAARLSQHQLDFVLERFKDVGASPKETERVTTLVDAELASRKSAPSGAGRGASP